MQPSYLYSVSLRKEVNNMKVCNNCNSPMEDHASFCRNCGASAVATYPAYQQNPTKDPISIGGWIGRSLIPYIPLVGGIVYLIMLFIWSGDNKKEDTFRNWAKAQLIIMAVVLVISVVCALLFGSAFVELMESL